MGMFDDNKYVNQISDKYKDTKPKGALTKQVTPLTDKEKESVLNMMEKTISKDDDFYKKVEHALKTDKITKENVDSSLQKITDYIDSKSEVSSE